MKKYLILLILLPILSCEDFLEEKQVQTLTQDFYKTETGLDGLIKSLYVYARVKHEWDANGAKLIEPETDAYMHSNAGFARIASAQYGNDLSSIAANVNNFLGSANANYAPMGAYPHINNCNIALDLIDNLRPGKFGTDDVYRNARRSEVLMLRAWAYYLVTNQLGDVPLLLTPKTEDNGIYYYPKTSIVDVYRQIITDVRFAYENLPLTQSEMGRITKWAAGHFLAKLYLNRAQGAQFEASGEDHLAMLFKGDVTTDLDSVISITTEVINGVGGAASLAADYWTLFDPRVSETTPSKEVLWAAQFDVNTSLNGRFGGNRSCNYHTGDYTNQTGVARAMAYGRPFGTFKPTDWGYDNFKDKINDSRYYKTFQYEYISNMPASTSTSYRWTDASATWWNANKPADEPVAVSGAKRILQGERALIYLENQKDDALDSAMVMSQPYQFMVRWIHSAKTGNYYYRLFINGANMGLATQAAPYLSSKKYVDPSRGGSTAEANFNSESGTRDAILMRLAETYLIRAEAYGRTGQYALAVDDINVLRNRAAYKGGETRPEVLVQWEPGADALPASEQLKPYTVAASTYPAIQISENHFTPGMPEADAEGYIPTITSKEDMFIHFIYNEMAREFLSEGITWEAQHNAGILYERMIHLNQMASDMAGQWPVAFNTANGNGQDGNGKGQYQVFHTFRPWPNAYLVQLTNPDGLPLTEEERAAYQNPGY